MRVPWWDAGLTPDEIGNLQAGGLWALVLDPENAVNPPLWRFLGWLGGPGVGAIAVGRALAIASGTLAVAAGVGVGRRLGGPAVGLLTGLGLALLPVLLDVSTLHRSYAAFLLVGLGLQIVLVPALEQGGRGRWLGVALLGALWVQLHYVAVVPLAGLLVLVALRTRSWRLPLAVGAPAVLVLVPWVDRVLMGSGRRVPSPDGPLDTVLRLASLGLQAPPWLVKNAGALSRALGGQPPRAQVWFGGLVLVALLLHLVTLRRQSTARQVVVVGAVSTLLAFGLAAQGQYVRPHAASQLAVFLLPLLVSVPALLTRAWLRLPVWGLLLALVVPGWAGAQRLVLGQLADREAMPHFLAHASTWSQGGPIAVYPAYAAGWLWTQASGQAPSAYDHLGVCHNERACYAHGDLQWRGVDARPEGPSLLVAFDRNRPAALAEGCTARIDTPAYAVWDCP